MKIRLIDGIFIGIGLIIGVILSLQIRANPVKNGSSPVDQINIQKALLGTFTLEQDELKQKIASVEEKIRAAQDILSKRSSSQTVKTLENLKKLTAFDSISGEGIRITLNDNPSSTRLDFSSVNDNFVQATDIRDLINGLFIQGAEAISLNGKRITPLTPIDAVFDTILIDNFQVAPPFIIEAVGIPNALKESLSYLNRRKLQIFTDEDIEISIRPKETIRPIKYIKLSNA